MNTLVNVNLPGFYNLTVVKGGRRNTLVRVNLCRFYY
jgi:hypothetical protein